MTKILVIEDEAPLRESIVDALTFEGYEVVEAENGLKGWERAKDANPDLIVCDIAMPELSGYDLLLKLREDPSTALLPFIFLTARADRPFMRHGMELGADDYLTKPFSHADLLAAINTRLQRHAVLREASDENLDALKADFIRHVTHELRTPLVSITTVQDIVEQQLGFLTPEELEDLLRIQRSGSQRLNHLVEQTVILTEIKIGALSREIVARQGITTSVWDVLTAAVNLARRFAYRNQEIDVHIEDQHGNERIRCRMSALRHALAEIIANAIAFSPENGQVRVVQWREDDQVVISVIDRGPGIRKNVIDNMFKEFTQFERHQLEQQGLGLGLPLAREVIRTHNGTVSIESNEGEGTTVTVKLPVHEGG